MIGTVENIQNRGACQKNVRTKGRDVNIAGIFNTGSRKKPQKKKGEKEANQKVVGTTRK